MNRIEWKNRALKQLAKLPKPVERQIMADVGLLANWPNTPGVIKLTDKPGYRLRSGRYRILFHVYPDGQITVIQIEEVVKRDGHTYS